MDLSRYLEQDHAILLAWADSDLGQAAMNDFNPNRMHQNTLIRIMIPTNGSAQASSTHLTP